MPVSSVVTVLAAGIDVLPFGVVVGANVAVGVKEVVSLPNKPEIVETIDAIKLVFEVVVKPVASLDVSVPDTFKDDTFEVAPFVVTVVFLVVVVLELDELLPPGILTTTALFTPSLSFPTATTAFAEISATVNAQTATPTNNVHLLIEPPENLLII